MGEDGLPFLYKMIAESMWRAMGWVCGDRHSAVVDTLNHVFRWRSTKWWQSTQASGMKKDPCNRKRWAHTWAWHNRRCVLDKLATDWAGQTDWMNKRKERCAPADEKQFVTVALDSVKLSSVHKKEKGKKNSR